MPGQVAITPVRLHSRLYLNALMHNHLESGTTPADTSGAESRLQSAPFRQTPPRFPSKALHLALHLGRPTRDSPSTSTRRVQYEPIPSTERYRGLSSQIPLPLDQLFLAIRRLPLDRADLEVEPALSVFPACHAVRLSSPSFCQQRYFDGLEELHLPDDPITAIVQALATRVRAVPKLMQDHGCKKAERMSLTVNQRS